VRRCRTDRVLFLCPQALDLLNRAKALTTADAKFGERDDRMKLNAITYNNMSCVYKRRGLLKCALQYAEKALDLETKSKKADNPACTHLNLCAILSQLDRHRHALEHCQCALALLKGEGRGYAGTATPGFMDEDEAAESSILAVCYHNMAVEHEYLGEYDKAIQAYYKSVEVATQELGEGHPVANAFRRRWEDAQISAENRRKKEGGAKNKKLTDYDKKIMGSAKLGMLNKAAGSKATPRGYGATPRGGR
jgi:tetratricopeptide (TPR) repeat protein